MPPERFRWAKVSAVMMDNEKIVTLCDRHGPVAVLYYVAAILYAKSADSSGQITRRAVGHIPMPLDVSLKDREAYVRTFLELRLWEEITSALYVIHNWNVYQTPGQERYYSNEREISPGLGITSERYSGSSVADRYTSPLLSSLNNSNSRGGSETGTYTRQRDAPTYTREAVPRCSSCSLANGYHLEDCPEATSPSGTGIAPVPGTPTGERCPSCGIGWGLGHSEDCSYDPRSPLTYSDNGTSVPEVMANAPRARLLRQRLTALRPEHERRDEEA